MFKFSCVLGITVYQCIQCECTWRWAYRNYSACGVYRWALQARLHRRTWGEEERTARKWRGSVWNIEICEIAWKTWGESLIRWGCDILGWVGLRLFGVRVQYNKAPAASRGGVGGRREVIPLWKLWELFTSEKFSLWSPAPPSTLQLRIQLGWEVSALALTLITQTAGPEQAINKVIAISDVLRTILRCHSRPSVNEHYGDF